MPTDELTDKQVAQLRVAAEWGLLRNMSGWEVCATGKASMPRKQLAALIQAAGGQFTDTVRRTTRLLVVADDGLLTSKIEKAQREGVEVMRESDFVAALLPTPDELLDGVRAKFGADR